MPNKIIIFTDGASKGNPGPGGWGAIIIENVNIKDQNAKATIRELGGAEKNTTNNRMELTGAIKALEKIKKEKEKAVIYTDSKYLINGITGWVYGWQKNKWQKKEVLANGEIKLSPVLNQDLWKKLVKLVNSSTKFGTSNKKIDWQYVGGHIGIIGNERCDEIASGLAQGEKIKLFKGKLNNYGLDILNF